MILSFFFWTVQQSYTKDISKWSWSRATNCPNTEHFSCNYLWKTGNFHYHLNTTQFCRSFMLSGFYPAPKMEGKPQDQEERITDVTLIRPTSCTRSRAGLWGKLGTKIYQSSPAFLRIPTSMKICSPSSTSFTTPDNVVLDFQNTYRPRIKPFLFVFTDKKLTANSLSS